MSSSTCSITAFGMCGVIGLTAIVFIPALTAQSDDFLLSPGKAGQIEVGMPVDEVYRLVGREEVRLVDLFTEGMFTPAIEIRLPGSSVNPSIVAPIREWPCVVHSIWGIEVRDPRFRTKEGVGVGSTLAGLRRSYRILLSNEEGPHAWVESLQLNFRLESNSRSDDVRVRSVWIPGNPVAVRKTRCPERDLR